jgi:hypothetical protein
MAHRQLDTAGRQALLNALMPLFVRTTMTDWPTFQYWTQSPISGISSSRQAICQT